ncbi:50S ribosomal protein L28 [Candidatus Uhrbacteria bacterium]|nr:50S ribosomal protein L28 [Candidatus Uhrbacteria bacterium]
MSKFCALTDKKPLSGNNVSHSKRHTRRVQNPNLQTKRLVNPATGKIEKIKISARGLRTLAKWRKEGKVFDLRKLNA